MQVYITYQSGFALWYLLGWENPNSRVFPNADYHDFSLENATF